MVEPGRLAGAREAKKKTPSSTAGGGATKNRSVMSKRPPEEKRKADSRKQQQQQSREPAESPSYRLALKRIFSCRNNHGQSPAPDTMRPSRKLGCSAPSICKLRDSDSACRAEEATASEPCKRRASESGGSEQAANSNKRAVLQRGTAAGSSSSSSGGSSFRASMQLRRLSGCYECHMVVDPVTGSGSASMRATVCPCPDCGEIFVRQDSLHRHQATRHAVSELGAEDTSRNIIEIIFQSSWLKKKSPVCTVERILKVHNTPRTLARFEEYRDAVKARAAGGSGGAAKKHPRCTADGNELLRFHCATMGCSLGLHGATHLCDAAGCAACGIIRDGFRNDHDDKEGIRTMATSGRAHDAVAAEDEDERRAMLVCRVIAGRVKRPHQQEEEEEEEETSSSEELFESVAGSAGVYSNLEELQVFNPRAILPCFVVVYKAGPPPAPQLNE